VQVNLEPPLYFQYEITGYEDDVGVGKKNNKTSPFTIHINMQTVKWSNTLSTSTIKRE
jgi:hypothetical protein